MQFKNESCFEAGSPVTVADECFKDQWRSYPDTQLITEEEAVQFLTQLQVIWIVGKWIVAEERMDFFFHVQAWQLEVWKQKEKLIEFISFTLIYKILNEDSGSSMIMCIIIALGKSTCPDCIWLVEKCWRFPDKCVYQAYLQRYFLRSVAPLSFPSVLT